jgi:hypothetical protein
MSVPSISSSVSAVGSVIVNRVVDVAGAGAWAGGSREVAARITRASFSITGASTSID